MAKYTAKELEQKVATFIKRMDDLDKLTNEQVKGIIDSVLPSVGVAFVLQELYKYFEINKETIEKINFKQNGGKKL